MKELAEFESQNLAYLFTDIDGTLTDKGRIGAQSYSSLWKLQEAGIQVIPVTGRPAGWCEMIARFWPVHGVIGENGAFYFRHDGKKMHRHFMQEEAERLKNRQELKKIETEVLTDIAGTAVASDQFSRLFDLAIDFCEDVEPLSLEKIDAIVAVFEKHGAQAKVSNIHVNGWFGDYDKLSACKVYCQKELGFKFEENQRSIAFIGDSPNDEPMFEAFENSFAVANIKNFLSRLQHKPRYIASQPEGHGFVEITNHLLK